MKTKQLCMVFLASAMMLSMAACKSETKDVDTKNTVTQVPVIEQKKKEVSIDFSDSNFQFVSAYTKPANAAELEISVAEFHGEKALKVVNKNEKTPYIGIDVTSLCKEKTKDIRVIQMTMGLSYADGTFSACSGNVVTWTESDLIETKYPWSVYLESKNPKLAEVTLENSFFVNDATNIMMITLETDIGRDTGHGAATLYISDIRFFDSDGNLIVADSSAVFTGPQGYASTEVDMTNLVYLKDKKAIEGFEVKGDAWAQAGVSITDEIRSELVPGAVLEIAFASESGDLWMVVTDAPNGWTRCGGQKTCTINMSGNVCQITYEELMSWCGTEDVSELKGELQCESDSAWEVYRVSVGQKEQE